MCELFVTHSRSCWFLWQHEVFESWAPFTPRAIDAKDGVNHVVFLLFNAVGVLRFVRELVRWLMLLKISSLRR